MIKLEGIKFIDISYIVKNKMPADPALKLPTLEFFSNEGVNGQMHNLEVISYCPHTGTHMDAPFHIDTNGDSIEKLDPTLLIGPAVVVSLDYSDRRPCVITADIIKKWEKSNIEIQKGDAVLLNTGHSKYWESGKEEYIEKGYVCLSTDLAKYFVDKGVRFVGLESISVDGPETGTEAHKILLGNNVYIVENLTNLDKIESKRCITMGTFPAVKGASGVWIRLLALV